MAFAYITEYLRQPKDAIDRVLPAGQEPALAVQKIAIGAGSIQSAPFNAKTTFVRINVDVVCSIQFGANPTATAADTRMSADATEYFGVVPGQRVAVITNT
jgi:hypothetical protein